MAKLRRWWLAIPGALFWVLVLVMGTPVCARCGDHDDAMTELIAKCPRAVELLGADPHPASVGMACGKTTIESDSGRASWSLPYTGDTARGNLVYTAVKSNDVWSIVSATLEVDGRTIDVVACAELAPGATAVTTSVLAQTNADAARAEFTGKVTRSNHATITTGFECTGKLQRDRASAFADVQVACRAGANDAEGLPLYVGRGKFTLDVVDASKREDDRFEYADEQAVVGARLSAAGGAGVLTVFSTGPGWEVVIEL